MEKSKRFSSSLLIALSLFALAFVLYWQALRVFFSLDDLQFLLRAAGIDENPPGIRRLVSSRLYFAAAWRLFGNNPVPYHVVSIVLHAANGCLIYLLARRLGLVKLSACAASILFTAAPAAFTPLYWISGVQDISMTFFALIAAYCYLGRGAVSLAAALIAAFLSVLCKESSALLLPALAVVMPAARGRRMILGIGGLLVAAAVPYAAGSFAHRPSGDPYETAFGVNVLLNFLTYTAWTVRIWDFFPDRVPEYQPGLAPWGLLLPAMLALAAWRFPRGRTPIARAFILFILLLLPVLPLVRHSYLYYLYLPLVPLWIAAGALLGNLPERSLAGKPSPGKRAAGITAGRSSPRRLPMRITAAILVTLFVILSAVQGRRHRGAEIADGVLADPILRYARFARNAVSTFRGTAGIIEGDIIVMTPPPERSIDLTRGVRDSDRERARFVMVERALAGGKAVRLFSPAVKTVTFEDATRVSPGWWNKHIFWTYSGGGVIYLGYGEEGIARLGRLAVSAGQYDLAERQVRMLLERHPDDPNLYLVLGDIALKRKDDATLDEALERLERMARAESAAGNAAKALDALKRMATAQRENR